MGIGEVKRAVFLDRDGVLNRAQVRDGKPYPPASLAELEIYEDAPGALARLKKAGYLLIVVTNQPDIARGTASLEGVDAINAALGEKLAIDEFRVCAHDDMDGCDCRKPKPGLLVAAAGAHGIDLAQSFLIGDRWRDIDCGAAAGVRTVWIDRGYRERGPSAPPSYTAQSLGEAAEWVLGSRADFG